MSSRFAVSTDTVGILGSASDWMSVYGFLKDHPHFDGIEMLGWRGTNSRILQYRLRGIETVGIHGQTGGGLETEGFIKKSIMNTINFMMDPPEELISCHTPYVLIHVRYVDRFIQTTIPSDTLVLVENDTESNSLLMTKRAIKKLKARGFQSGMMFDVVHYLRAKSKDGSIDISLWNKALSAIEKYKPLGVHIPIGTHMSDSLPYEYMSLSLWKEYAAVLLKAKVKYRTIENQQDRKYSLILPKSVRAQVRARNERIVDLLTNARVI